MFSSAPFDIVDQVWNPHSLMSRGPLLAVFVTSRSDVQVDPFDKRD